MSHKVGILAFQGCIQPHVQLLNKLGATTVLVSSREQLDEVDRLIIPGGESTTMLKFIDRTGLKTPLVEFGASKPVWGICAGSILLAKEVQNPSQPSLGLIDIRATRNFYGSQTDSFTKEIAFPLLEGKKLSCHFIRAPMLSPLDISSQSKKLHVLAEVDGHPVFFAQGLVWACSFHVELGNDPAIHEAFLSLK